MKTQFFSHFFSFLLLLLFNLFFPNPGFANHISIRPASSSDGPLAVTFSDQSGDGNELTATVQIENLSGTWIYVQQDYPATPEISVNLPFAAPYLLGPGGKKIISNVTFNGNSYLALEAATPIGVPFNVTDPESNALYAALLVDLMTRGLLDTPLPSDAFDQPFSEVRALLDPIIDEAGGDIGEIAVAIEKGDYKGLAEDLVSLVTETPEFKDVLEKALANHLTASQIDDLLGAASDTLEFLGGIFDILGKADSLYSLTSATFHSAPNGAVRFDASSVVDRPSISHLSTTTFTVSSSAQNLSIYGANFAPPTDPNPSMLVFFTPSGDQLPERTPIFQSANELRYRPTFPTPGTWKLKVINGKSETSGVPESDTVSIIVNSQASGPFTITPSAGPNGSISPNIALTKNAEDDQTFTAAPALNYAVDTWYVNNSVAQSETSTFTLANIQASQPVYVTFKPLSTPTQTGSLKVNLAPDDAISKGAQWQVDNGSYHNNAETVSGLSPGIHTISFKSVSSYQTPPNQSASVVANQLNTANATYFSVGPSTYTLTLVQSGNQGSIVNQPFGAGVNNIYTYSANTLVKLSATAGFNYHFVSWGGDAASSGSANPTTILMTGSKTVSANFASGDPSLGTLTVTIDPPEARAAGIQWGFSSEKWYDSGASYTTEPHGTAIVFKHVDGWIDLPMKFVTIAAGQTTVQVTATKDTTPGTLIVNLMPPGIANAKWHIEGGAEQGAGSSLSLQAGTYTVVFDPVAGWTPPPNQTVSISRGQTTVVNGNYMPPAGQPVIGGISPPTAPLEGGTALTISGLNLTSATSVSIGGHPATDVQVVSASQISCRTPSSSVLGSAAVTVQTATGTASSPNGFAYSTSHGNKLDLVNSFGGACLGVAVDSQGKYAYVGQGRNLLALTLSNPSNPSKMGQVSLPGIVNGIALFGHYAYIADGESGLQVVDISDPSAPTLRGAYSTTQYNYMQSIQISGGLAYVADTVGLEIFDLQDPTSPTLLSSTDLGGGVDLAFESSSNGLFAYVITPGAKLCVVDVSNQQAPILRGTISTGYGQSISLSGQYALIAEGSDGVRMFDISDPDAPIDMGAIMSGADFPAVVATVGDVIYVGSSSGFSVLSRAGINVSSLGHVNGSAITDIPTHMSIFGNYAYIGAGELGLASVDISSARAPSFQAPFSDSGFYGASTAIAVTGDTLLAGHESLNVFTGPDKPGQTSLVASPPIGVAPYERTIVAENGIAYVNNAQDGIDIVDLTTPGSPQLRSHVPILANVSMTLVGNLLYAVDMTSIPSSLFVVDVSNSSSPSIRLTKDFTSYFADARTAAIAVAGKKAIVAIYSNGSPGQRLVALDVSDPNAANDLGSLSTQFALSGGTRLRISDDGNYAYVISPEHPSVLHVVNISDPANMSVIADLPLDTSTVGSLELRNDELYAATYRGLYVFDITNPALPALQRAYPINNISCISAPTDSMKERANVYLSSGAGGIVVLKEQDIQPPEILITNPFQSSVQTANSELSLGGNSQDDSGVTGITWSNSRGGGGSVDAPLDNWFVSGISLFPGTNVLTVSAFDQAGNVGSDTLTVLYQAPKLSQTISFPQVPDEIYSAAPIILSAAASSGEPVKFTVVDGPATLTGNILSLTGTGTITIQATQEGDDTYDAATPVKQSFQVTPSPQFITFAPISDRTFGDAPFAVSASASSGAPVMFSVNGPASITDGLVSILAPGSVTIQATQAGNANYLAADDVSQTFQVAKAPQVILFDELPRQVFGDAPFPLNATASSGLDVQFQASGSALLSGNILTLIGPGTVTIQVTQGGNDFYAPAAPVERSLIVTPGNNLIGEIKQAENGDFTFRFFSNPGESAVIESSTDLNTWFGVTTNIVSDVGYLEFSIPLSDVHSFFRIQVQ